MVRDAYISILHIHTLNLIDLARFIKQRRKAIKIITHLHCISWKNLYGIAPGDSTVCIGTIMYDATIPQHITSPNAARSKLIQLRSPHSLCRKWKPVRYSGRTHPHGTHIHHPQWHCGHGCRIRPSVPYFIGMPEFTICR